MLHVDNVRYNAKVGDLDVLSSISFLSSDYYTESLDHNIGAQSTKVHLAKKYNIHLLITCAVRFK